MISVRHGLSLIHIFLRRPKFDKKYFKVAAYSFAVLALCILLNRFLDNIGGFFSTVDSLLMAVKGILITFIYGLDVYKRQAYT